MFRGRRVFAGLALAAALALTSPGPAGEAAPVPSEREPQVSASSAVLMEWSSGAVLYAKGPDRRRHPASTTKIVTALVALENAALHEEVLVSRRAASMRGTDMGLKPGDVFTMEDLLYGLMLASGNDAAVAIAEHVSGSVQAFAVLMNEKAWELGARGTRFTNPHGLTDPGHFSTARDLALIARAALRDPVLARMADTPYHTARELRTGRELRLRNTNRLLHQYEYVEGVKTGTTPAAGDCLVSAASRTGFRLVAVVLDARDRWADTMKLLDYGFENFLLRRYVSPGERVATLPVRRGMSPSLPVATGGELVYPLDLQNPRKPLFVLDVPTPVRPPVYQGQAVGQLVMILGGEAVARVELVAEETVLPSQVHRVAALVVRELLWFYRTLGGSPRAGRR